ncbi:DUF5999 family protein [Actinoplanes cyaneus]|nr:DUF5999 family protein [Actinoplanes cyaneus]MCW2139713.1 hypothetical protein [Actinoplanes cyaneus]
MCEHQPPCPPIDQPGWESAQVIVAHDDLGWSLLCNGAVVIGAAVIKMPIVLAKRRRAARSRGATAALRRAAA